MQPATKKQKVDQRIKIIAFKLPDAKPDVRFRVFDTTEFHVHSVLLKIQSAFFRKFLDSPEKVAASGSTPFRYEWVSQIDDDGSWSLVASDAVKDVDVRGNNWSLNPQSLHDVQLPRSAGLWSTLLILCRHPRFSKSGHRNL